MANIAETVKKQTDRILRQRALNGSEGVVVRGVSSGPGAPAPNIDNPPADLTAHKASSDHDGRYYTEGEIDGKLNFLTMTDTPAAYTGEGGKIVAVKSDVSGLEFVAAPPATNGLPTGGANNQLLAKDGATDYAVKWMDAPAAANGLPAGGTAGQVLEKVDGADYNAQWADPSGGGGTPSGDGTEDTLSSTLSYSGGTYSKTYAVIETLVGFWLASIKWYFQAAAGVSTVTLRKYSGEILGTASLTSTDAGWHTFTFASPIELETNMFLIVVITNETAVKDSRITSLYTGTLWACLGGTVASPLGTLDTTTKGLGLVEYDDTP